MVTKSIKLQNRGWENCKIPSVPNYILRLEDNFCIPIEELDEKQLRQIGKVWTEALVEKAKQRTKGSE